MSESDSNPSTNKSIVGVLIPLEIVKTFMAPLNIAITRACHLCTSESARELTKSSAEIWDIVSMATCDDEGNPSEDLEGDWVDVTKLFIDIQVEVAQMCASAYADSDEDQAKAWTYIMTGFRLFDAATTAFLRQADENLVGAVSPVDEEEGLFANHPVTNRTIH